MRTLSHTALLLLCVAVAVVRSHDSSDNAAHEEIPEVYNAMFKTNKGYFNIEVHRDWAPIAADRFFKLMQIKYFNQNRFFRVIRNDTAGTAFVAQWGISGDPERTAKWNEKLLPNEKKGHTFVSNTRGTVAFGAEYNEDKTSTCCRSTELYVNYGDNSRLDDLDFTPFGVVTVGMDVLDSLYAGYGEAVNWTRMYNEGNVYLDENFPLFDRVIRAKLIVNADVHAPHSLPVFAALTPLIVFLFCVTVAAVILYDVNKRAGAMRAARMSQIEANFAHTARASGVESFEMSENDSGGGVRMGVVSDREKERRKERGKERGRVGGGSSSESAAMSV